MSLSSSACRCISGVMSSSSLPSRSLNGVVCRAQCDVQVVLCHCLPASLVVWSQSESVFQILYSQSQ